MVKFNISIKRVYDEWQQNEGFRVLVDRLWPRGLSREKAGLDLWAKEIAPSDELRKWFNHEVGKWADFRNKYIKELNGSPEVVQNFLKDIHGKKQIVFLFGAKDKEHNQALVLKEYIDSLV
ncbi:DUF488 domain-containing protein [Deltaproteobacteria bacterium Smac51]|nr:DUF488 domain-containing protein [Deltaproteobacteria bacterium Smac51]